MNRAPFTEALKQRLLAVTSRPGDVGRAPKPADGEANPNYPYWVLHPLPGGRPIGPPARPEADATFLYQVTYVGLRGDQLEQVADRGRAGILARDADGTYTGVAATGITVMDIEIETHGGIDFDGAVGNLAEIYAFHLTTS